MQYFPSLFGTVIPEKLKSIQNQIFIIDAYNTNVTKEEIKQEMTKANKCLTKQKLQADKLQSTGLKVLADQYTEQIIKTLKES